MDDCISRQMTIDALNMQAEEMSHWSERYQEQRRGVLTAVNIVADCPSEQPDIIRCKDCKHRDPEDKKCDCGHDIQWQLPRQDNWYCADAERREDT